MIRNRIKQNEHDKVLLASFRTWARNRSYRVHANPNQEKNFSVNGDSFPDIVITTTDNRLLAVEEVETEDGLNINEVDQWREYADFGVIFNLIVPIGLIEQAKSLCTTIPGIHVQGYTVYNDKVNFIIS